MRLQRQIEDYSDYLEKLTTRSVRLVEKLAVPGVRFIDPFHDVRGTDALEQVLEQMLRRHPDTRIRVDDRAVGRDGKSAFLRWTRTGGDLHIEGMTELLFGPDDLVYHHHDHWDGSLMLPASGLTGLMIGRARRKM